MGPQTPRTLIISDTHLGSPRSPIQKADDLRPLWQGFERFVINGDVAELSNSELQARAAVQVQRLQALCEADGVELVMISGNHDPLLTDRRHLMEWEGLVFITHGDILDPSIAPWAIHADRVDQDTQRHLQNLYPRNRRLSDQLEAHQHAAHNYWIQHTRHGRPYHMVREFLLRPWAVWDMFRFWRQSPRLADRMAQKHAPLSRFVILGHTHRQGWWTLGKRTVINTGSFDFPGKPLAVAMDGYSLAVHRILALTDRFGLEHQSLVSFERPMVRDDQHPQQQFRKRDRDRDKPDAA